VNGRICRILGTLATVPVVLVTFAVAAQAAVTVSRAELSGGRLRVEGQAAPSRPITIDGAQMTTSSSTGSFKVDRSGFTGPADCTVDVSDGVATAADVRLSGCVVTTPPPPPPPASTVTVDSVSLSPATLQGGGTSAATVTLTGLAPSGGAIVALSSSDPTIVTVPASVTVPAGVNSWPAFVSTAPVTTTATSVVSATYNGTTRTATMTVTPPPPQPVATLDSIVLSPSTVQTGTTQSSATLTLTAAAPAGGAVVTLSSSNPAIATVPATVTVPVFSSSGAFSVTVLPVAGTATISASYAGVTRSAVLTVTAQTLFRITTPTALPNATVGQNYAGFIEACCGQGTPYTWSLVSGTVPAGLSFAGNALRLVQTTGVTGVATRVETTTFTVRARDQAGNSATKTFTLSVDPAAPLVITNQSDQLPDGQVGVAYATGLFPGGGVPPWRWTLAGGTLPPGLALQASPGRIQGTPTTPGTYSFTVRVDDSGGQFATGVFTIRVLA
jgi:Putative Ig domain